MNTDQIEELRKAQLIYDNMSDDFMIEEEFDSHICPFCRLSPCICDEDEDI